MSKRKDVTVQTIFSWAYEDDDPEPTAEEVIKNCAACDHILDYEWNVIGEAIVYEKDMWNPTIDPEEGDLEPLEELEPWPDPEDYAETSLGCDIDEEA